jgi:hypothetical protein
MIQKSAPCSTSGKTRPRSTRLWRKIRTSNRSCLEETPWFRQAQNESQARRNVGILFDDNRLNYETDATLRKLTEMQLQDGRWPWFPGGPGNDYITLYIVTGFGRLRHLGADIPVAAAQRALQRLDQWMDEHYQDIQKNWARPEDYVPSATDALYLYGRSFFLSDTPIAPPHQAAVEFFLKQSRKFWLQTNCRQSQGQMAIALKRWGGADNSGGGAGHHALAQGAQRQQRGDGPVLARHRIELVVVSRAH